MRPMDLLPPMIARLLERDAGATAPATAAALSPVRGRLDLTEYPLPDEAYHVTLDGYLHRGAIVETLCGDIIVVREVRAGLTVNREGLACRGCTTHAHRYRPRVR